MCMNRMSIYVSYFLQKGNTVVHRASAAGSGELIRFLVEAGAPIICREDALSYSPTTADAVQALIDLGVDFTSTTDPVCRLDLSFLCWSCVYCVDGVYMVLPMACYT